MSEKKAFKDFLIKLGILAAFVILYSLGGMDGFSKVVRRGLGSLVLCGGIFYFTRSWKQVIQWGLMWGTLSLGYGGDILITKIIKRGIFGLANGASSGFDLVMTSLKDKKVWILVGFQIILVTAASICFGVWNPFPNARIEEPMIALFIGAIPIMSARRT